VFNAGEENLSSPDCGQIMKADNEKSTTAYQVYNGRTSVKGEHPWFALVEVYFANGTIMKSCGGTLIKENVVLTGNILMIA
jgi:V8-like Glu-specific endopeptidase